MRLYFRFILIAILSIIAIPFFLNAYASAEGGTGTITVSVPMTLKPPVTAKEYSGISINLTNRSDNYTNAIYTATTDPSSSLNSDTAQTVTLVAKIPLANVEAGTSFRACTDFIPGGGATDIGGAVCSEDFDISDPNQNISATIDYFSIDKYDRLAKAGGTVATANDGKTTCSIEGIGWIVCPVMRFLGSATDGAFRYLSTSFLEVDAVSINTSSEVYKYWQLIRNIANIAFVLAFLIIIFMQVSGIDKTSYGLNYGVKKLLPRLIIAAILVNISYLVCQIVIDLSNILGYSFFDLFGTKLPAAVSTENTTGAAAIDNFSLTQTVGAVLIMTGVALYVSLASLVPVVVMAFIALIVILLILVLRQAVIILLIVVSPLAFVAYLLPNTEGLFKKWKSTLIAMLMLFPIIGLIFGVSTFASKIITGTFTQSGNSKELGQIVGAAIRVLPLFVVPSLLKKSLDAVGNIGASLNGIGGRLGGTLGKSAGSATGAATERAWNRFDNAAMNGKASIFGRARAGVLRRRTRRDSVDNLNKEKLAMSKARYFSDAVKNNKGGLGGDVQAEANAISQLDKLDEGEIKAIETVAKSRNMGVDEASDKFIEAVKAGKSNEARAYQRVLLGSGGKGKATLQGAYKKLDEKNAVGPNGPQPYYGSSDNREMDRWLRSDLKNANLTGSNAPLAKFSYTEGSSVTSVESDVETYKNLNVGEWAGQSYDNLSLAIKLKVLTPDMAKNILENPGARNILDESKTKLLTDMAKQSPIIILQ